MTPLAIFAVTQAIQPPRQEIIFHRSVKLTKPGVTLADLADLSALPSPIRAEASRLQVATFQAGQSRLSLSVAAIETRLRALMPALRGYLPQPQSLRVSLLYEPTPKSASTSGCLVLRTKVRAGEALRSDNFAASDCAGAQQGSLLYDRRSGLARAARALEAGDVVHAPPQAALAAVRPHDQLYLNAALGVVTVERRVEVLQAGRRGGQVFVRGASGPPFAVPVPDGGQ